MRKQNAIANYKNDMRLTYKQLAKMFGIVEMYAYQIASNRRKPSTKLARKIHELTGIPILHLLYPASIDQPETEKKNDKKYKQNLKGD